MADRGTDPRTQNYSVNVFGGVGGSGGMSERGTGGNGGIGQGPTIDIKAGNTVNILSADPLEKLHYVPGADIDAQSPQGCLEGTRVDLLADLRTWSRDPDVPRIFWLDGMAGTGKSAIARSFCHMLRRNKQLGGSFFCLRGDANQGNPMRILPTLAMTLASQDTTFKSALLAALNEVISSNANLEIQIENLLEVPLRSAYRGGMPHWVLVIDALDELDDEDNTKDLLRRLVSVVPGLPIKLFVTSRPERHIRPHFDTSADLRHVLRLHDIEANIVKDDISLYFTNCLASIRAESRPMLPEEWASLTDIEALTCRAGKLFIYASTAVKYIGENPEVRLQALLSIRVDTKGPLPKPLDDVYRHILSDAMDWNRLESDEIALTKHILAVILTVGQPVSVATLGGLVGVPAGRVRAMLDRLHAVIHVPSDNDKGVLSTFHASFGDFLTTPGRVSDEMLINLPATHITLFSTCIQVMESQLNFNISNCPTSYFPNTYHELKIPALLQYVCLYWAHHMAAASAADEALVTLSHLESLKDVFLPKFLFWVEVLSAINKASVTSNLVMTALTSKCFARAPQYLTKFLADANEFVVSSLEAIETSVAHIYVSALPCVRPTSEVAKAFWPKFDCILQLDLTGIQPRQDRHQAALILNFQAAVTCIAVSSDGAQIVSGSNDKSIQVWDVKTGKAVLKPIEGLTHWVESVAFSPDGALIVSASNDETIRVWDARTGEAVLKPIDGHTRWVRSVAFSPDGAHIVSGSHDKTICVWDARTGEAAAMRSIKGHTGSVKSVAFSPDGAHIVSGSDDKTIRVWDARTGEAVLKPIKGHRDSVRSVAFSPDGAHIVSGSDDKTICVWNARTGEAVLKPIKGHRDWVRSVAFSPDGAHIVSGSDDKTICVWDAKTGKAVLKSIKGHTNPVISVAFSPDGARVVSGSSDKTICVWDARTGEAVLKPIKGHTDSVTSVAFSPNGAHIVSGSHDKTICVWDARTGEAVLNPIEGHTGSVNSVAFSPDGACIVSGSKDKTVRVWDIKMGGALVELTTSHTGSVISVAISPNGARIMAASYNGHIHVWDAWAGIFTEDKFSPSVRDFSTSAITLPHAQGSWIHGSGQELLMWVP
ncbi:WD40-repeat-containing domain protein, partial [Mycena albidolilacea]